MKKVSKVFSLLTLSTEQYALMEASFVAVRMLQSFSEINPRDPRPWTEKVGLNLSNKNGVVVELVRDREATV